MFIAVIRQFITGVHLNGQVRVPLLAFSIPGIAPYEHRPSNQRYD